MSRIDTIPLPGTNETTEAEELENFRRAISNAISEPPPEAKAAFREIEKELPGFFEGAKYGFNLAINFVSQLKEGMKAKAAENCTAKGRRERNAKDFEEVLRGILSH
jgi:hypothetical protein